MHRKGAVYSVVTVVFFAVLLFSFPLFAQEENAEESGPPLITNVFLDADIREVLQDIATQAGVPILADDTVSGVVSLELNEVPLEKALDMVLAPLGFTYVKTEDYYLVSAGTTDSPAFKNMARTVRIPLRDLAADEFVKLLPEYYTQFVKAIEGKNFIVVTAPEEIIKKIEDMVQAVDSPRKQVVLDAVVTEISGEEAKNLGIEWGGVTSGPYSLQFGELASIGGIFQRLERIVATLNFLEREGKARIRSNPRLVVMDGETGEMSVIREEYFAITTGTPAYPTTSLETISAGVVLKVIPRIVGEDEIILSLNPEVSNVVGSGIQELPVISRRKVNTTVRVKSGETLVIGGLRQLIEVTATSKVPLLGDLPLIGGLFRSKKTTVDDKDIVMLITPTIME
ncbi:MAG: secretin and TonB N-terminal domain-containing protein [Candidatus Atribacteria bacterium]|nr:secretin and TonB N-terminal domain-containing protein [Candidatus Atribacteria bacterium]